MKPAGPMLAETFAALSGAIKDRPDVREIYVNVQPNGYAEMVTCDLFGYVISIVRFHREPNGQWMEHDR